MLLRERWSMNEPDQSIASFWTSLSIAVCNSLSAMLAHIQAGCGFTGAT